MDNLLIILKICFWGIISFCLSILIFPLIIKFIELINARKKNLKLNAPIFQALHSKKSGTPTMGGILFWFVPIISILIINLLNYINSDFANWLNFLSRRETYLPLGFLVFGGLIGLIDDIIGLFFLKKNGLSIKEKLIVYFAFSIIITWWIVVKLGIRYLYIPFIGRIYVNIFIFSLFLIFYFIAVSFSANETDGLDGLLGGIAIIIIGTLTVISFINGNYNLVITSIIIISSLLLFLWFNVYPAKIFMGDTGSMAIGSYIAVVSLLEGVYFLLPLLAFIFVLESYSVIIQTISKKIFKKKVFISTPIHHHFEALNIPEPNIVFKFWLINLIGALIAFIIFILDKLV
ncbi:MAG: phospho-N-acetylmuramoyl-pentapeptide-transferase [Candidatus Parcubacteria bacterium]|nr:MAG: phospho-N-acetylmuramoyl-pentapeptide-transferase [Candidatus Parcubacteria bacterium]